MQVGETNSIKKRIGVDVTHIYGVDYTINYSYTYDL